MKINTVVQNTDEWHKLRETRIGASEANIIMGVSEYQTLRELWMLKTSPPEKSEKKENNYIQNRGHKTEPRLRTYLEMLKGSEFPAIVALSEQYDFLMASLDGYSEELNAVFEGKLVGQDDFELVRSGKCLPQYYPQIQQQLLVTGAEKCFLVVGAQDTAKPDDKNALKFAIKEVFPDMPYLEKLLKETSKFWQNVKNGTDPGYGPDDVMECSDNEKLSDALHRLKLLLEDQEALAKTVDGLKAQIFKMAPHCKIYCDGATVYQIQCKDSIVQDFKAYAEDTGLVLPAKYVSVKKGAVQKKITFPKPKKDKEE